MAEQWLSIVEYARTYSVSDMTVRRRIKTGRLKAVLRDGKYYIPIGPNGEVLDFDDAMDMAPAVAPVHVPVPAPAPTPAPVKAAVVREPVMPVRESTAPRETPAIKREAAREASPDGIFERPGAATFRGQRGDQGFVDSQALLQFCDNSVSRMEKQLHEVYQGRIQTLESQLKWKDGMITQLRQQVEDLQMLVTLMEQSRK